MQYKEGKTLIMAQSVELNKFHNSEWDYFKDYSADFDRHLGEITKHLGNEFIAYLRSYLQKYPFMFPEGCDFKAEFVIDSNIVFAEVLSLMKEKPSFLGSIIDDPFLTLYAPPKIIKEVKETIERKLPKNLNRDKAKKIAQEILSKITILKGQRLDAWIKAYTLIGKRDKKDVPFLALAFSLDTQGVITKDKDFTEQEEIRIWKLGETGRMISDLDKGSFSFFFLGTGLPLILQFCYWLCVSFLKLLAEVLEALISVIAALVSGGVNALSKIPPWILTLIGTLIGVTLILSKEAREKAGDAFAKLYEIAIETGSKIKEAFSRIIECIKQIIEMLMPFVSFALKGVGYLFYSSWQLIVKIHELEESKPRGMYSVSSR